MAPPKKKTKGNVVAVDSCNEELKEIDEECRNEVPKHPRNLWIFFYQEQCKLKDADSSKPMDLSSVRELDWSQFVLKFLAEGIQKYQKGRKVIRGCLLFLMLFYLEHCTPAEYFTSQCGMRPSPRLSAWGDKDIREKACWFNKTRKRKGEKVKVIIEDGVGKRENDESRKGG
ncbi:uncharacterized protein LOC131322535 isoform X1 [Rhododendron vialii]|uniref:uncharacterized protein LOC131322535 isoform X1 n=1 Tax=Rhododendron vialii TaxID=182163 RepID=UPI00265F0E59|nr:uncharacterized protein LOC131322535 isoform X1 [Rhododendron vialii]